MAYTKFAESEPYDAASGKRLNQFGDELQQQINDCLKKVIHMPSGTNVSDCYETGIYRCTKWVGCPADSEDAQGTLIVINYVGTTTGIGGWVQQEFLTPHSNRRWIRSLANNTDSGWQKIATTTKTPIILTPTASLITVFSQNNYIQNDKIYINVRIIGDFKSGTFYNALFVPINVEHTTLNMAGLSTAWSISGTAGVANTNLFFVPNADCSEVRISGVVSL